MAELRQVQFRKHFRGISQDDMRTEEGQVLYSSGVNLNRNTYQVSVNPEIVEGRSTNGKKMLAWFYTEDSVGNRVVACAGEDGEVYNEAGTDNVADFIFSDGRDVRNAIIMGDNIYFVRTSGSAAIRVGSTPKTNVNLTGITENITTLGDDLPNGTTLSKYPMFNFNNNILIIGVGGTLCTIDRAGIVTNYNIFAKDICGITRVGGKFRIYSSNGEIAFWRFGQAAIDESYNLDDYQNGFIRGAINRGGVDFIISGFNSQQTDIRLGSGYQAPILAHYIQSERISQEKFKVECNNVRQLTRIGDTIYFVNETTGSDYGLWSYGYKNVIFGDAFQEERLFVGGRINSVYGFQGPGNDIVYMSTNKGSNYKISSYEVTASPTGSGEIYYNVMDGGDASMEKKMQSIFETVSDCSAGNTVDIQLSYDKGPFSSIREFTSSEGIDRQEIAIPNKEFTDIVLRVIITGNAKHHAVRMRYEIIEE